MLILTRRNGESVLIDGQEIKVTILGVKGNQVLIGIEAPKDVSVHREEVYERIQRDKARGKTQSSMIDAFDKARESIV